jgi:hypothetical protein
MLICDIGIVTGRGFGVWWSADGASRSIQLTGWRRVQLHPPYTAARRESTVSPRIQMRPSARNLQIIGIINAWV